MTQNNDKIVDDYYSSISSDTGDKETSKPKKIKTLKKKISIKKVEKKESDNFDDKKEILKEESIESEKSPKLKKLVKKEEQKVQKPKEDKKKEVSSESIWNDKTPIDASNEPNKSKFSFKANKNFKLEDKNKTNYDDKPRKHKLSPFSSKKTRWRINLQDEDSGVFARSKSNKKKKEEKNIEDIKQNLVDKTWETVVIQEFLNLKEFSEKIWVALPKLMSEFMKNWLMVNINSKIDFDTASIISEAFDIKLERDNSSWINVEDVLSWDLSKLLKEEDASKLKPRPPVVSIMWHVDHWKTSLLDYIRKEKVALWEAWWITQSIWAYQVDDNNWKKITFIDTPWHEAFTIMRARWAKSTDIAILVVAADEWVKPQTIESINHARESGIPIIVAINKMDKVWANPDLVKWWLSEAWVIPEDWGWDVPCIPVSAMTWFGVDELIDMVLLVAEMQELKANPDRLWVATVLESHLDTKLWPVASVLINSWTINHGDSIVCKWSFGKVKILKDYRLNSVKKVFPWDPALIVWLDSVLEGWDIIQVVSSLWVAKEKSLDYKRIMSKENKASSSWMDMLMSRIKAWTLKQLKIVLKADTNWSLEAIKASLVKLSTPETTVSIIHSWVWNISESDVLMCQWSNAILIWFNVWLLTTALSLIEETKVEFIKSDVIYNIIEKVEKIVTWMFDPKEKEVSLCKAKILDIFYSSKEFMVIGLKINEGETVESNTLARVFRWDNLVWKWKVVSLKHWVEEFSKLEWPLECWIKFSWNIKVEIKDFIDIYKIVKE